MELEFSTATRIVFGRGKINKIGELVKGMGQRALVVLGVDELIAEGLLYLLNESSIDFFLLSVHREPTIDFIQSGLQSVRRENCDFVISFGGGSAIDTGKAISALLTNTGDVLDYLEVIGNSQVLSKAPVPFVAIPTTAGTGSEVTRNAVLGSLEHRAKVSLRSPLMLPRLALIDPELTLTMSPAITAFTGLDAITQVIEPFVSIHANPLTDGLCREGLKYAAKSLEIAYFKGDDISAREGMSLTSLIGGLALANAKLGAVHGFAGPFGGMFHSPHGAVCARLLPFIMGANVRALRERQPESTALGRYDEIAQILVDSPDAVADDGVRWVEEICYRLNIPPLSKYGLQTIVFQDLIGKARLASSMQGNPIQLTDYEMATVLEEAI
ncbi:iron-containing alcohol dehydrogenase [Chloroflexota bacterium]